MKNIRPALLLVIVIAFTQSLYAQSIDPLDVDTLFNFAEQVEPSLFSPPGQLTLATVVDWLYRFYPGTGSYAAVHVGLSGEFVFGGVYTLGGPFGDEVVFIDTLTNLLVLVNSNNSNGDTGITNNGNGNCVDNMLPAVGTIANYSMTSGAAPLQATTSFSEEYIQVSNTLFEIESSQSSNIGGLESTTNSRTLTNFEIMDDLRYLISLTSDITSTTTGFGTTTQRVENSYDPHLFQGPAVRVCEGMEWSIAPVTQTLKIFTNGATVADTETVSETSPETARVESISDSITVPAGTFDAIRSRFTFPDIINVIWHDPETGLLLRNENIDRDDAVITILTELQSIEN